MRARSQGGFSYNDKVLFSDLVEDHLADVVLVERRRQWNFCPLTISAHQQVGFICKKGKRIPQSDILTPRLILTALELVYFNL